MPLVVPWEYLRTQEPQHSSGLSLQAGLGGDELGRIVQWLYSITAIMCGAPHVKVWDASRSKEIVMLLADEVRPQLTEVDAAKSLGIKPSALRKMRQRGRGPAFYKINRAVRYDPADVAAYLGRRRVAPAREAYP